MMKQHDIVYILKNDINTDEIRYSLRSVEKNFPHRKVWFYGGCPDDIWPDEWVHVDQEEKNKWERVSATINKVCKNDSITEEFWLFNDDFFVMKRVGGMKPAVRGTLAKRVEDIGKKHAGVVTSYSRQLRLVINRLRDNKCDRLDYALHVPMLINRKRALEVFDAFPGCPMFRSLYGNYWSIGGEIVPDVKVFDNEDFPKNTTFLSTNDAAFKDGRAGEYIRSKFKKPSRFEEEAMT